MKSYDVSIGSISWISKESTPIWLAGKSLALKPNWIPKTYMGLYATANSNPPSRGADFRAVQSQKDFRALAYAHVQFDADESTGRVSNLKLVDSIIDSGWTPYFHARSYPSALLSFDSNIWSWKTSPGEASPLSGFKAGQLHPNASIGGLPRDEAIIASGLIKFRAGEHTDTVGVDDVGCPFHVPWVWCEICLTLVRGTLRVRGRGSIFPSHAWYLNGDRIGATAQVWDSKFPKKTVPGFVYGTRDSWVDIDLSSLKLYPVLSAGAPASGEQFPLSRDLVSVGSVEKHPYTATGGPMIQSP